MMAAVCLMAAMTFAAQCAATTKKGTQCKRQASPGSEFCWQHGGTTKAERAENGESEAPKRAPRHAERNESGEQPTDAPAAKPVRRRPQRDEAPAASETPAAPVEGQCQATTRRGTQCRRKAVEGGKYCAQHAARMGGGEATGAAAERPRRARKPRAEAGAETGGEDAPAARPRRSRKPKAEAAAEPAAKPAEAEASGGMCQGKSKNGEPCKRKAKPGSKFCWQHDK